MKFLKGLYKDTAPIDQPAGTYRDALNMVLNLDKGSMSTEYSTRVSSASEAFEIGKAPYTKNFNINGSILLPDNRFIVFYSYKFTSTTSGSFIFLYDPKSELLTLLFATSNDVNSGFHNASAGHLNFSKEYPITGEAKIAVNGDIIIYFTDNFKNVKVDVPTGIEYIDSYNPPRAFNVTKQLKFIKNNGSPIILYNTNDKFGTTGGKSIDYLNLFLTTNKIPQLLSHSLVKGGILEVGAYYLCLAYATDDFTETNVFTVSQPVYIPKGNYIVADNEDRTTVYGNISANGITPVVPFEHMTGAPSGTQTSFAIKWTYSWRSTLNNNGAYADYFDLNYPYLVPYIIKYSGNTKVAYKLPLVPTETFGEISFTGNENYAIDSIENIVLDKATYLTAKNITQLDNKMYLGNLTSRKDIGYQRFANSIKLVPVQKEIKRFDARVYDALNLNFGYTEILKRDSSSGTYNPDFQDYKLIPNYYQPRQLSTNYDGDLGDFWTFTPPGTITANNTPDLMGGYRNQYIASYLKSYRRGEVYAFYISFVLNDGTETYAYHIPGRDQTKFTGTDYVLGDTLEINEDGTVNDINYGPNYSNLTIFENDGGNVGSSILNPDLSERLGDFVLSKVIDTSEGLLAQRLGVIDETHNMGYWVNESEFYPQTDDFKIYDVDYLGNSEDTGTSLYDPSTPKGVRHHKFPSNLNPNFSFITQDRTNLYRVNIPASVTPNGHVEKSLLINLRTATTGWNDQFNQSAFFYETINILGFKLTNVKIPRFILKQIQGFKVYYAKRTLENKTILGQSLLHPSFHRAHGFFATNRFSATQKARGPYHKYWSFYGNIPDFASTDANSYIKYDSYYIGQFIADQEDPITQNSSYNGYPITKFHDFKMLRERISLNIVDYISIQSMITMHQFAGGFRNASILPSQNKTVQNGITQLETLSGYEYFLTGQNDNEEYTWVAASFGNLDSKYPNVDADSTSDPTFGEFTNWVANKGIHRFYTNVMIGARYNSFRNSSFSAYENSTGDFYNPFVAKAFKNIFTITNNGASYITALTYLKITETDAFHGAQYLDNYAGETGIALAIKTGIPFLLGYVADNSFESNLYDKDATYEYDATYGGNILSVVDPTTQDEDYETIARGKANMFLANLNSYKTDVFNPFDNQTLVWTGYYHPCQITKSALEDGSIGGYVGDCTDATLYTLDNSSNIGYSLDSVNNVAVVTANNIGDEGQFTLHPTNLGGDTIENGNTYNVTLIFDPIVDSNITSSSDLAYVSLNGGIPVAFDAGSSDTFVLSITAGSSSTNSLLFDIGVMDGKYNGTITVTMTVGTCTSGYNPGYLEAAFQNTPDYANVLNSYAETNNYYTGLETGWIFGGDTFICRYGYRSTSMDFPNYYLTQNVGRDVDASTPGIIETITTGFGTQMSLPESIYTTANPISVTEPYNGYLGAVAFMNQRVLRTYGTDRWPMFSSSTSPSAFILLNDLIGITTKAFPVISTTGSPVGSINNYGALDNFHEVPAPIGYSTLYSIFVESEDNINFRHAGDSVKGVGVSNSLFFDSYNAADIVFRSPLIDLTKQDNLLYEDHYSALQDIKTTVPFPKKGEIENIFPSRVIRSNTQTGSITDNFRYYLALQYKDFSQNKGNITNLSVFGGLLFIHTEKSLYKTIGKQNLQLGDTTEAYIGSGDIFAQEPIEFITSPEGYGGCYNQHSAIINKYGYLFVSRKEKKVFLLAPSASKVSSETLEEISLLGMEKWFRTNIPYTLETYSSYNPYPINLDAIPYLNTDAPTGSFGFISSYDPLFKRFIITKRELVYSEILESALTYFQANIQYSNVTPNGADAECFQSISELNPNYTIPFGTGVSNTNLLNVINPNLGLGYSNGESSLGYYYAPDPETNSIWFDTNLGVYIFTPALGDYLTDAGYTNWEDYVTPITMNTWGESSETCYTAVYYAIHVQQDNFWWKESGWTISFYPDNKSWVSRHSYVSPWYMYNSETLFSFKSKLNHQDADFYSFYIWKHDDYTTGSTYYGETYNYELEVIINDSPEITKILESVNFIADAYSRDERGVELIFDLNNKQLKDNLNKYDIVIPFKSFYIYNTYQLSEETDFGYLTNIRRVEGNWVFNNFRDSIAYDMNATLSDNTYNVSGGFNTNVQTPKTNLMFLGEGIINTTMIDSTKPWYNKKRFMDKFFGIRLKGESTGNLVNLYSINATLRKSAR